MTSTLDVFVHPVIHVTVWQVCFCNQPALIIEAPQEHETRDRRARRRVPGTTWSPELLALLGAQPSHLNLYALPNTKVCLINPQQLCEIMSSSVSAGISRLCERACRVRHPEQYVEPYKLEI
jgi:hypothetical protein